jgi:hypothetical protein
MVSEKNTRRRVYPKDMILPFFQEGNDNPGYLPAVLCLWSQARPWELPLAAIISDDILFSPPIVDLMLML